MDHFQVLTNISGSTTWNVVFFPCDACVEWHRVMLTCLSLETQVSLAMAWQGHWVACVYSGGPSLPVTRYLYIGFLEKINAGSVVIKPPSVFFLIHFVTDKYLFELSVQSPLNVDSS